MKSKITILVLVLLITLFVGAQRKILPTDSFTITGNVKTEGKFTLAQLDSFPKQILKDHVIYNHKGEIKDTLKNVQGILLKNVLATTEYRYQKPKELNEFYFVFVASDGYKVVFSWNEIYNTDIGNHLYIITALSGKTLAAIDQRIMVLATTDLISGRRFIKGLQKIEVKRID